MALTASSLGTKIAASCTAARNYRVSMSAHINVYVFGASLSLCKDRESAACKSKLECLLLEQRNEPLRDPVRLL